MSPARDERYITDRMHYQSFLHSVTTGESTKHEEGATKQRATKNKTRVPTAASSIKEQAQKESNNGLK